jgi:TatD DNase family protein
LFINIHTHTVRGNGVEVQSLYRQFEQVQQKGIYSIGIHPCYDASVSFEELLQWSTHEQVVAIGECGLDIICNTNLVHQQQLFAKQVQLANELNKPLIIHCVKAWGELVTLLQPCTVPVVVHGFNKSKELAMQLVNKGYYLSFGKALQQQRIQEIVAAIPKEQLLLETDIADIAVDAVYQWAANAVGSNEEVIRLQIVTNAVKVFGEKIMKYDN